ncbi:MAG: ABC transporter ATP-binding protein [Chloroflexota bacterium]
MAAPAPAQTKTQTKEDVVLTVEDFSVHYDTPRGDVIAVNHVSFELKKGELLGLIGESGCGKTTTAMAILRLVQPPGRIVNGTVTIEDVDVTALEGEALRKARWSQMALIPQGAMNSLNPLMRIKDQIADVIETHEGRQNRRQLEARILKLFTDVGLPSRIYNMYPHELSGGMKQRACIALGIALNPPLIIADEPTSALDVIVQRIVAQTLLNIRDNMGVSMVIIGHDMGLMAQLVDKLAVMYAGNMVEIAPVDKAYAEPLHPYTQLLIESIPSIKERKPLKLTEGLTHDLRNPPPGCIFQFRCPKVWDKCREVRPELKEHRPGHLAACHLYDEEEN